MEPVVTPRGKVKDKPKQLPFQAPEKLCKDLLRHGTISIAPKGTVLFVAGQPNHGVYVVLSGRVALSAGEQSARITRLAERNCLLGLPATFRRKPYSLSAHVVQDAEVCRIKPEVFLKYMASHPPECYHVMQMLSNEIATLRGFTIEKA